MQKAHSNINWVNYPQTDTPINETNLNKMDKSIDTIDDRVITLDTTKLDLATGNTLVKTIEYNKDNGTFTITCLNGSVTTIDTDIEKVAVNFDYDATTQKLIITLDDGTKKEVDLSALITQYEFTDTSTVGFSVSTEGKVSANVLDGSITEAKLQPDYLADIKVESGKAETAATNAETSATNASESAKSAEESAKTAKAEADRAEEIVEDLSASYVSYDNSSSGATATNVQSAIDEAFTDISNKQDKLTDPLTKSDVVDDLTTETTDLPLSAKQGKVLKDLISSTAGVTDVTNAQYIADKEKYDAMDSFIHITDDTGNIEATEVIYDDSETALDATTVQSAIEKLSTKTGGAGVVEVDTATYLANKAKYDAMDAFIRITDNTDEVSASNVSYDNTTSGLTSTDVQSAVDEVESKVSANDFNTTVVGTDYTNIARHSVTQDNSTTGENYAYIQADMEGGNLRLSKAGNTAHLELDTCFMNGSDGHARLYLGNNSTEASREFAFCEDGSFQDGNGVNTKTLKDSIDTINKDLEGSGTFRTIYSMANEIYGSPQPFVDFHYNSSSADYTSRIIESESGVLQAPNLFRGTVIADANDAPYGYSAIGNGGTNNPYAFWCTLLTLQCENSSYKQQFAYPWGQGESQTIKYRVYDGGTWFAWHSFTEKPTLVFYSGDLMNASGDNIWGYGTAEVELKNGVAKIEFNAAITTAGTGEVFTWGLNRDFLTSTIGQTITPINGGICEIYTSNGTKNFDLEGYGGMFLATGQFWTPARNFDKYNLGAWGAGNFVLNTHIRGVCYGTY